MDPAVLVAICAALGTAGATAVTGYFGVRLRRTPDKVSESADRIREFQAIMDERQRQFTEQEKRLNDQSAQIRVLRKRNRTLEEQIEDAQIREGTLSRMVAELSARVAELEGKSDGH